MSVRSPGFKVFAAYSHADAALVTPVVTLLRVNRSFVFQDTDSIRPGTKWRDEIGRALEDVNLVVVFWCRHAFRSEEVSREWRAAVETKKDVLPLLLDSTPLPAELGDFQWIDFRGTVGGDHGAQGAEAGPTAATAAAPRPMSAPGRRTVWYTAAGVAALAVLTLTVLFGVLQTAPPQRPGPSVPAPPPPSIQGPSDAIGWVLAIVAIVAAGSAWLVWRYRRRRRLVAGGTTDVERRIAAELEHAIVRRAGTRRDLQR